MRVVLSSVHAWPEVRRGAERYVHELAAGLARSGCDVRIVTSRLPGQLGPDEVLGVAVDRLVVPRGRPARGGDLAQQLAFGWRCAPAALLARCDVWHANSTADADAAVRAARLRGFVTVFTDHGFPARASRERRVDRRHHARVVAGVDRYVCVSEAAGRFLSDDFGRAATIVPPGVHLADHAPGVRSARPSVLYVGAVDEPRKHVVELLRGAVELARAGTDLEVWLHGPGDIAAAVGAVSGAEQIVTRSGLLDPAALPETYATAWTTALVSEAESFGMAVVESLASGTPALVLAGSGGPESIVDDDSGVVAADLAPTTLAEALGRSLDLARRDDVAEACRSRAAAWDWDGAVVPRMLAVYEEAVRAGRGGGA